MILSYILRYPRHLILTFLALGAAVFLTLLIPWMLRDFIDDGLINTAEGAIAWRLFFLFLVGTGLSIASALRYLAVDWLKERIAYDLRRELFNRIMTLDSYYFDGFGSHDPLSNLVVDVDQIKAGVGMAISIMVRNGAILVGSLTMIVVTAPGLAFAGLLAIPVMSLPFWLFGRNIRRLAHQALKRVALANSFAAEMVNLIKVVQGFNNEQYVGEHYRKLQHDALALQLHSNRIRALLTAVGGAVVVASVIVLIWFAVNEVLAGRMTFGDLNQFIIYAALAGGAFGSLVPVWGELSQARAALDRITSVLQFPQIIVPPDAPVKMAASKLALISFERVSFCYPNSRKKAALIEISLAVEPGETVALVGPSGAGKSTIFNLLMRFYNAQGGKVCLNGIDARDVDPLIWRRNFTFVPQTPALFSATISQNIAFGNPAASDKDIRRAAESVNAAEFITKLPDGYDTPIGENGRMLSGGQRQLLALARALIRDAPVLLLDEATSSLDAQSESMIKASLEKIITTHIKTTLIIAHRLSTVKMASRILVINDGQIAEQGSHARLLEAKGLYARLAELQLK